MITIAHPTEPAIAPSNGIAARDLVVEYQTVRGTVQALWCHELTVEPRSSVAVMGPSGCGKSTLLGLLAGLALPTRGSVVVGGTTVSSLGEQERVRFRRRSLGMVYQADNLLPHLTVEENVGLQLSICGSEAIASRRRDPGQVLNRLGLGDLAHRLPDQLSGGQRQRTAVARAIVHGPTVILADEPTGALDADNAHVVMGLLIEVQRELEATLVVVTHDPAIAGYLDRTVVLTRPVPPHPEARVADRHRGGMTKEVPRVAQSSPIDQSEAEYFGTMLPLVTRAPDVLAAELEANFNLGLRLHTWVCEYGSVTQKTDWAAAIAEAVRLRADEPLLARSGRFADWRLKVAPWFGELKGQPPAADPEEMASTTGVAAVMEDSATTVELTIPGAIVR